MSSDLAHPHQVRGAEPDLVAVTRLWQWERTARRLLPGVLLAGGPEVLFQAIFEIENGLPFLPRGYEALARFPLAPRIPVGMWFRIADDLGLRRNLELSAARNAAEAAPELPEGSSLFINASLPAAPEVSRLMPVEMRSRLVVDIPFGAVADPRCRDVINRLRGEDIGVAIDDIPVGVLHTVRTTIAALCPQYVKVDVVTGLGEDPLARFDVAQGAVWCRELGIVLVAERVGTLADLTILRELGVSCAQGYALTRPFVTGAS